MTQITVDIPDELISRLNQQGQVISDIIIKALESYIEAETYDITQTQTWKLCGSIEIPRPDSKYIIGQNGQGQAITNYAEVIDEILY